MKIQQLLSLALPGLFFLAASGCVADEEAAGLRGRSDGDDVSFRAADDGGVLRRLPEGGWQTAPGGMSLIPLELAIQLFESFTLILPQSIMQTLVSRLATHPFRQGL